MTRNHLNRIAGLTSALCCVGAMIGASFTLVACDTETSRTKTTTTKTTETPEGTKKTTETTEKKVETERKDPPK